MHLRRHRCVTRKVGSGHPLAGKIVYIPAMTEGSVQALVAVFRWLGIEALPTPASDARTRELGGKYTSGDECYPAKVTVGDLLRVIEQPGFDAGRSVFLMATGNGPCRFGQYAPFLRKLLRDTGHTDVQILSPSNQRAYSEIGDFGTPFLRGAWRALVSADILRKLLLQTRPYETAPGAADHAFQQSVADICRTIESSCSDYECQLQALQLSLARARQRFAQVPAAYDRHRPLIGVVGEIFCRLNTFSNEDLVRKLEDHGAECWISDIAEWVGYTNAEQARMLRLEGRAFSIDMLKVKLRVRIQRTDEHALLAALHDDFAGYEEPAVEDVLRLAEPYLPNRGVEGEMVMSTGKAAYLALRGADGVVDISPFTCMNGIVSESIYPKLSRDFGGIPIRNFYFDGTQSDLDRDLGIYLEVVRSYRESKPHARRYPARFGRAA